MSTAPVHAGPTTPLEHALAYARLGWRVVPIPPGYKHPHGIADWPSKATTDAERITRYWSVNPDHGIGIACGPASGVVAIDIDTYAGGDDGWRELEAHHGPAPETVEAVTGGGGRHLLFAHPDGLAIPNVDHLPPGVDVRGEGGQIVVAPSVHPTTGRRYAWELEHDPLDGYPVAPMPGWLAELLTRPPVEQKPRAERAERPLGDALPGDLFAAAHTWPELLERDGWTFHSRRVSYDTGETYELWTRPGKDRRAGASASLYYRGSDVLKVFTSQCAPLMATETYTRFGYEAAMRYGGDHAAAARAMRRELNGTSETYDKHMFPVPDASSEVEKPELSQCESDIGGNEIPPKVTPPKASPAEFWPYTDLGNARRLVAAHGEDLHHVPEWGAWLRWDGQRWVEDLTNEVARSAKAVVDGFPALLGELTDADKRKALFAWWMRSQSVTRLEAMVRVAATEPNVPVLVRDLDADPWALNTLGGTVDLRTGTNASQARAALCTKLAPVTAGDGGCPRWEAFVHWAMRGDEQLVEFLRRAVGYTLSGSVSEQVLFFCHGAGSNGKSTFLAVIQHMLGDYAFSAEADLLLAVGHERHSTGIADLHGRRMVVVQEIDEGRRLDEALVKRLTGGDVLTARRMRQDNFEFRPTHKLWMAANHRPVVRGTDHAIWRRIRLIPFAATVDDADKNPGLVEELLAEAPGILRWALQGCREWLAGGLAAPAAVLAATASYRSDQDHVGRFLEECCVLEPSLTIDAKQLRAAYERWCFEGGEKPWSAHAIGGQLTDRGCTTERTKHARFWRGLALAGEAAEEMGKRLHFDDWASRAAGNGTEEYF